MDVPTDPARPAATYSHPVVHRLAQVDSPAAYGRVLRNTGLDALMFVAPGGRITSIVCAREMEAAKPPVPPVEVPPSMVLPQQRTAPVARQRVDQPVEAPART